MIKPIFLFILLGTFFISCQKSEKLIVRKSTGDINTISVIIEDQLWNGEIGESIRNKFASPLVGLLQEEPLFTINQYPTKLLEGFITDSRTIIVVKKDAKKSFQHKKNQYANPQNVFHITGETNTDLLKIIEENSTEIIQIIKKGEIAAHQRIIRTSTLNIQNIIKKFKIGLNIPKDYKYAVEKNDFIWLKKEINSGSNSILIYQLPLSSLNINKINATDIIKIRDSVSNLYIRGTESNTQMITDLGYAPYFSKVMLNEKPAFETRGTWELKNDFMSGSFINYALIHKEHQKILVLEGFCYSPSKASRDLLHELESIIKSLKFKK